MRDWSAAEIADCEWKRMGGQGVRPEITDDIKGKLTAALAAIPEGKSAAVVAIVDENGGRIHGAWKVGDRWKVGGAIGKPWAGKPTGYVAVEWSM